MEQNMEGVFSTLGSIKMIKKTAAQITVLTAIQLAIPMVLAIRIMPVKQTARMIPKVLQAARNS